MVSWPKIVNISLIADAKEKIEEKNYFSAINTQASSGVIILPTFQNVSYP
jgi:hypothetical protein